MRKNFFIVLIFMPSLLFADVQHIGKWLLSNDNNSVTAMTSSPTGGILNISCLPNNALQLELYSFFQPTNKKGGIVVVVDGDYSVWNYQGNGIVTTSKGATILEKNIAKKAISVELFYEKKSIVKYNFDIDGIGELSTKLKSMCHNALSL